MNLQLKAFICHPSYLWRKHFCISSTVKMQKYKSFYFLNIQGRGHKALNSVRTSSWRRSGTTSALDIIRCNKSWLLVATWSWPFPVEGHPPMESFPRGTFLENLHQLSIWWAGFDKFVFTKTQIFIWFNGKEKVGTQNILHKFWLQSLCRNKTLT